MADNVPTVAVKYFTDEDVKHSILRFCRKYIVISLFIQVTWCRFCSDIKVYGCCNVYFVAYILNVMGVIVFFEAM